MSANFKLIDFFWRERMSLIHVGLLIFHRVHFAIENVTNGIFFGSAKREMSVQKRRCESDAESECPKRRKVRTYMQSTIFFTKYETIFRSKTVL